MANDGGSAFPFAAEYGHPAACGGMSLRDYFAAKALAGLLAHASGEDPNKAPAMAYKLADAMLAEREKGK